MFAVLVEVGGTTGGGGAPPPSLGPAFAAGRAVRVAADFAVFAAAAARAAAERALAKKDVSGAGAAAARGDGFHAIGISSFMRASLGWRAHRRLHTAPPLLSR